MVLFSQQSLTGHLEVLKVPRFQSGTLRLRATFSPFPSIHEQKRTRHTSIPQVQAIVAQQLGKAWSQGAPAGEPNPRSFRHMTADVASLFAS